MIRISKRHRINLQKMHNAVLMAVCLAGLTVTAMGMWLFVVVVSVIFG